MTPNNSLPSPEYTGDSDSESEFAQELIQRRRQLDEEVARFRAQKDKELREFEIELKSRRAQKRVQQQFQKNNNNYYHEFSKNSPSATPPVSSISVLNGFEKKIQTPRQLEPIRLMKSSTESKVTPPTICLDKISIIGENVSQAHVSPLQTPPTPTAASRVPVTIHACSASIDRGSPRNQSPKLPDPAHEDKPSCVFAPPYLSIFESSHDGSGLVEGTQTEPTSPTGHNVTKEIMSVTSSSLPVKSSMSNEFQVPATKRAYTSPSTLNPKMLAPIIRNVNGRKRVGGKRKHVTFQLADRAIVEPSSSYEEGPSPDLEDESDGRSSTCSETSQQSPENDSAGASRPAIPSRPTPLDPFGRRKRTLIPEETPESEIGMNMGDLLFGTDKELHQASPPIITTTNSYNRRPSQQEETEADGYFSARRNTFSPDSPSLEKSAAFGSVDDNAYMTKQKNKLVHQRNERKSSRSPSASPVISRATSYDDQVAPASVKPAPTRVKSPCFSPQRSAETSPKQLPHQQLKGPRLIQDHHPGFLEDDLLVGLNNVGFFELDEELDSPQASRAHFVDEDKEEIEAIEKSRKRERRKYGVPEGIQTGTSVPINIVRPGRSSVSNSWIGTFGH